MATLGIRGNIEFCLILSHNINQDYCKLIAKKGCCNMLQNGDIRHERMELCRTILDWTDWIRIFLGRIGGVLLG